MIYRQSKGMQHCRDIKKDALTYWYLFGGNVKDMKVCIKLALEEHVKLLQEEAAMKAPIEAKGDEALSVESGWDHPF